MATIEKRGDSYRIVVSLGYDAAGKRIRRRMEWQPPPDMPQRQIEKELNRQAVAFEDKVKNRASENIRLTDFIDKYLEDYACLYLKPKTFESYEMNLRAIRHALGHIHLDKLKPTHINSFYAALQKEGVRGKSYAVRKVDLLPLVTTSQTKLAAEAGIARSTLKAALDGNRVSVEAAGKIAAALHRDTPELFTVAEIRDPLTPATVNSYHRTLNAVLAKAVKWGYIQSNPAALAERPSMGRREAACLDETGALRLLGLLRSEPIQWRALITFDLLSGLRRGELLGLRWCDVDMTENMIVVRQTSNYLPGKGVYTSTPKTDTSGRVLRLSASAMAVLQEYKQWQDAQRCALGADWEDRDGRIFTNSRGAPIFPDTVTRWFAKFVQRSGLPKISVHSLRHTYATLMIDNGVPIVTVAHQLGHAQASTTANIYAHAIASAQAKAAATFDRFDGVILGTADK